MRTRVVVLGAGFGGLELTTILSDAFGDAIDIDFQARGSSLDQVTQLCANHGAKEHNMKGFGAELFRKMRGCAKTLEEGTLGPTS